MRINRISIEGFKSIKSLKGFELNLGLNIMIGANGAGKSNFISFFKFLSEIINKRVQLFTRKSDGANRLLYNGAKITTALSGEVYFSNNGYIFNLEPTQSGGFVFERECLYFYGRFVSHYEQGSGHNETKIYDVRQGEYGYQTAVKYVIPALKSWIVYHFHDTGEAARVKQLVDINNNISLETDAGNLAPFLLKLQRNHPLNYNEIVKVVQKIAPYFKDFSLRPNPLNLNMISLEWFSKESDQPFSGHQLSDGTIRFICLATVLLQPNRPSTIIIDEPELGLHPYALTILASLLKSTAGSDTQLIISTQSTRLVNEFDIEDIIVVDRENEQTTFKKLNKESLKDWLEDYNLGEIWEKNIIGGRPK